MNRGVSELLFGQSGGESISSEELSVYRLLLALTFVLVLVFRVVFGITGTPTADPWWGRIAFSLIPLGLCLGSFVGPTIRNHLGRWFRAFIFLIIPWFATLAFLNDFSPRYALGIVFVNAATSVGFGVGLRTVSPGLSFLVFSCLIPIFAAGLHPAPETSPLFLTLCVLALALVYYPALQWRVQTENDLEDARDAAQAASELKSRLLANVSHEFRTPLTSIMGFAESIRSSTSDDLTEEFAQLIEQSAERLQHSLETLLRLASVQSGEAKLRTEDVDLREVVRRVAEGFEPDARRKELELTLRLPGTPVRATTDPSGIEQILTHLVDNAIKFTEAGSVTVEAGRDDDQAYLAVIDTGIGISAERQEDIFQAGRQEASGADTDIKGTGLGLALARRLAEKMGGRLSVSSEKGTGSRFVLRLPVSSSSHSESNLRRSEKSLLSHTEVGQAT